VNESMLDARKNEENLGKFTIFSVFSFFLLTECLPSGKYQAAFGEGFNGDNGDNGDIQKRTAFAGTLAV